LPRLKKETVEAVFKSSMKKLLSPIRRGIQKRVSCKTYPVAVGPSCTEC
jgi:hypothetical protein